MTNSKVDGAAYDIICRISKWHMTLTLVFDCEFPVRGPVGGQVLEQPQNQAFPFFVEF